MEDVMEEEKNIHLLLVDDEENFLKTVASRLTLKNFNVSTAATGEEAIALAENSFFDVAVLDLQLPGIDGTKLLDVLKKKHKYLEIIILTGHGNVQSAVECTKLGAFGYLEKPFDFDKLIESIKDAYKLRLQKKFEHSLKRMEEIQKLSLRESPFGLLKALARLDDDEK
jgi:DNA-binding NtrC family response regulator